MAELRQTPISQLPPLAVSPSLTSPVVLVQGGVTYRTTVGDIISLAGYTDEMAQDAFAAMIAAGTLTGITATYDDAGNAIGFTVAATATGMTNPMTAAGDLIYGGSGGAPTRLAAATNGYILTLVGGSPAWAAPSGGGGGGLTNFSESVSSVGSGSPYNRVLMSASTATYPNYHVAIVPKGVGGFALTDTGSSVGLGEMAVDLQRSRGSSSQLATGLGSFAAGSNNTASGTGAVAIGDSNYSTSGYSFAAGYLNTASSSQAVALGRNNTASESSSVALGEENIANSDFAFCTGRQSNSGGVVGRRCHSSGYINSTGGNQVSEYVLRRTTSSGTPVVLTTNGQVESGNNQIALVNYQIITMTGTVTAISGSQYKVWKVFAAATRDGGASTTAVVGTPEVSVYAQSAGASGWGLTLSADTTNGRISITATGAASTTITWNAVMHTNDNTA